MSEVLSQDDIDMLLTAINAGDCDRDDFRPGPDTRRIKIYDFKRPDKFSRNQIRAISMMHDTFARMMTTYLSVKLKCQCHVHVASVDQLTYEEFIRSIPTPTTLAVINPDPFHTAWIMEIDPAVTFAMIDALMGGTGDGLQTQHELTEIEQAVMETIIIRSLGYLRESWAALVDLRPRIGQIETNPQFCQIVPPNDMTVLVTLECKVADVEGMINIEIPHESIREVLESMDETFYGQSKPKKPVGKTDPILIEEAKVVLRAELFTVDSTLGEAKRFTVGDLIMAKWDHPQYTGALKIDNIRVGFFKYLDEKDTYRIELIGMGCVNEGDYMEEKMNCNYESEGLDDVKVKIICELGRKTDVLKNVKGYGEGSILELDKLAGEPVDVFVNNVLFAKGEVVIIDENFGVRLCEMVGDSRPEAPCQES